MATLPLVTGSQGLMSVEQVPRITAQELKQWLDSKRRVAIVDTRSMQSYQERHIEGSILVPVGEIAMRYQELPRDIDIVFYCT